MELNASGVLCFDVHHVTRKICGTNRKGKILDGKVVTQAGTDKPVPEGQIN
jgi:hypothetical protein